MLLKEKFRVTRAHPMDHLVVLYVSKPQNRGDKSLEADIKKRKKQDNLNVTPV